MAEETVENIILGIGLLFLSATVLGILWLSVVNWKMLDRLSIWFGELTDIGPTKGDPQRALAMCYLRLKISGSEINEDDFSSLPRMFVVDRYRRMWYAFLGFMAAIIVGGFWGFLVATWYFN